MGTHVVSYTGSGGFYDFNQDLAKFIWSICETDSYGYRWFWDGRGRRHLLSGYNNHADSYRLLNERIEEWKTKNITG
jgi:hypothetical protein